MQRRDRPAGHRFEQRGNETDRYGSAEYQISRQRHPDPVEHQHVVGNGIVDIGVGRIAVGTQPTSCALVIGSPLANSVTSCPIRTNSSVRYETYAPVPPYSRGGTQLS